MSKVTEYLRIEESDRDEIIKYYEIFLNSGPGVRASITQAFKDNEYYGFKAVEDGITAGYFTFQKGVEFTYPREEYKREVKEFIKDRKIFTVDTLMVLPEYRRRGIGSMLSKLNLEMLKEMGVSLFMVEIWIYPDGSCPAKDIYENMGRVVWDKTVPDFYVNAHDYGFACPICGKTCKCGAKLEVIEI